MTRASTAAQTQLSPCDLAVQTNPRLAVCLGRKTLARSHAWGEGGKERGEGGGEREGEKGRGRKGGGERKGATKNGVSEGNNHHTVGRENKNMFLERKEQHVASH